jgi:hypothetical protein
MAFTDWVMPHLALGPDAAGGGVYTGPLVPGQLVANIRRTARRRAAGSIRAARADQVRATAARETRTGGLCLASTPSPTLADGETATVRGGHTVMMAITVPAHIGTVDATLLAQPTVTSVLVDPRGRVVQKISAGSTGASGLFRTLTANSPAAGTWHLDASAAASAGASAVVIAVHFAQPPTHVKLAVAKLRAHGKPTSSAVRLRFSARVSADGRPAKGARATIEILVSGQHAIVLHLSAERGHADAYSAKPLPLRNPVPAAVLVRAVTRAGSTTAQFELQSSCLRAS